MHGLFHSLKRSCRIVVARPWVSLMVVITLALGIAGNAVVFSISNSLFRHSLPFPASDRLVDLDETAPEWNLAHVGVSNPDLYEWRAQNSTFESMAFFRTARYNLSTPNATEPILGAQVTREMLDVLRLKPFRGRNFIPCEDRPGGTRVVLLSYGLWQRIFRANPRVLGELVKLDHEPYTVIGVLPREAVFPEGAELWLPLAADPNVNTGYYANGIGRLKAGVSLPQAQADLVRIHKAMIVQGHATNRITSPILTPLRERYVGDFRTAGHLLWTAVATVLLIAGINIRALAMVHNSGRARELAVRGSRQAVGGHNTPVRHRRTTLNAWVVCEISLALMLSTSAGLLFQAFRNIRRTDRGSQPQNTLTFCVRIPDRRCPEAHKKITYLDRRIEPMQALPGMTPAAASSAPPRGTEWGGVWEAEGGRTSNPRADNPSGWQVAVTPKYFGVNNGRRFEQPEGESTTRMLAVVNQSFADYFGNVT